MKSNLQRRMPILALLLLLCTGLFAGCGRKKTEADKTETVPDETAETVTEITGEESTETVTGDDTEEKISEDVDNTNEAADGVEDNDYNSIYSELINHFYEVICIYTDDVDYIPEDGESGVIEYTRNVGQDEALKHIGYAIEDISGDGVPELLVGLIEDTQDNMGVEVFAIYTCVEGKPTFTLEGWSRNAYFLMYDNGLFNTGSGGAMYTMFGIYRLTEDGTALDCESYYFTQEKDESFEEILYFTNTTGEWDKNVSEEISEEEFWGAYAELEDCFYGITYTSFEEYSKTQ